MVEGGLGIRRSRTLASSASKRVPRSTGVLRSHTHSKVTSPWFESANNRANWIARRVSGVVFSTGTSTRCNRTGSSSKRITATGQWDDQKTLSIRLPNSRARKPLLPLQPMTTRPAFFSRAVQLMRWGTSSSMRSEVCTGALNSRHTSTARCNNPSARRTSKSNWGSSIWTWPRATASGTTVPDSWRASRAATSIK